jgi:hypothetical protein
MSRSAREPQPGPIVSVRLLAGSWRVASGPFRIALMARLIICSGPGGIASILYRVHG